MFEIPQADGVRRTQCPPEWSEPLSKVDALVNWLSQFNNDDLTKPLNAILCQIDKTELTETGNKMKRSVLSTIIDPFEPGREMAQFFNVSPRGRRPNKVHLNMTEICTSVFKCVLHRLCSDDKEQVKEILEWSVKSVDGIRTVVDIMHNWSISLINKFRRSECITYELDALYGQGGIVLSTTYEDFNLPQSVHKMSEELRVMQYNILLGLEEHLGFVEAKCCGLMAHCVTEHRLVSGQYKPVRVSCEPCRLDQLDQSIDQFMSEHFGQTQLIGPFDRHLYWTILFWFRNSQVACNQCETISDSPVALVFTAYAYASKFARFINRQLTELIDYF
ncbi:hypothetical protein FGIG_10685 [Fasciola gigantica]|uniref:Uncharacterized protein n=1 Tax=Fasciola gigantica TaxID=46835 RepID=A0A504WV43_FASGI|nr:hypothetical protein FGIG_10685 [Fasciola gigantica]